MSMTRRTAIAGLAAGTATGGLATAATAKADPIFAALKVHRDAWSAFETTKLAFDDTYERFGPKPEDKPFGPVHTLHPAYEAAADAHNDATDILIAATEALIATRPTTLLGVAAALEQWGNFFDRDAINEGDRDFLEWNVEYRFTENLVGALRSLDVKPAQV